MKEWDAAQLRAAQRERQWTDYPIGVAHELIKAGFPIAARQPIHSQHRAGGFGTELVGGAGGVVGAGVSERPRIQPLELAKLCQRAEVQFVGMPCGIMDQYVSVFGREHSAVEIDCRSLQHRYVELPEGVSFIAVNTMVKHALGVFRVPRAGAGMRGGGRDYQAALPYGGVVARRVGGAVRRSGEATAADDRSARQARGDGRRAGQRVCREAELGHSRDQLMVESHRSLQHDYEVSCAELDFLVDTALTIDGVYGSRMTGGGFGGCTVTMLRSDADARFRDEICARIRGEIPDHAADL